VQVQDAQNRLHTLDNNVTSLTLELKRSRSSMWTLQREYCNTEAQLESLLRERHSTISSALLQEEERLCRQETQLNHELNEVRHSTRHWSQVAKRQDSMLQQHHDAHRPDDERILAKHPAGVIFDLSKLQADVDSEDSYDQGPRRGGWNRGGGQEEILGSSVEDEPPNHSGYRCGGEASATVRTGPRPPLGVEPNK